MRIEYESHFGYSQKINNCKRQMDDWLHYNLCNGHIEEKIDKFGKLLIIITEKFLSEHPEELQSVVDAIDCTGFNHKLIGE